MSSSTNDTQATRSGSAWLVARPLWVVGAAVLVVAAVGTEVIAAFARVIGVPLEVPPFGGDEAQPIFVGGFAMSVFFYGVPGIVVALALARWTRRSAPTWAVIAVVATALSLLAPITVKDTATATKVVLSLSHIVSAAVIIPPVVLRLSHAGTDREGPAPAQA